MSILIIEHSDLTGSERLGDRLRDDGHRSQTVRVYLDEPLTQNLDEVDAVLSCGGPQSPKSSEPWMKQELKLLKEAHKKTHRKNALDDTILMREVHGIAPLVLEGDNHRGLREL